MYHALKNRIQLWKGLKQIHKAALVVVLEGNFFKFLVWWLVCVFKLTRLLQQKYIYLVFMYEE